MDLFRYRQKHTPQTEFGPSQRVSAAPKFDVLVFIGWVLMSHRRKNSDKVIGEEWIYSDTENHTPQTECGPLQRASAMWLLFNRKEGRTDDLEQVERMGVPNLQACRKKNFFN